MRKLVGDARQVLAEERGAASDQALASIERTLRYASIDDEHRPALASGTLTTEVEAPGFGAFAGMALPAQAPPSKPKRESAREHRARVTAAQADLKDAQKREREAKQRIAKAEKELADAHKALDGRRGRD